MINRMLGIFSGLRGKLTLTYTLVTVSALLALEILVFGLITFVLALPSTGRQQYLSDVRDTLSPQVRGYLEGETPDLAGLQSWLEGVYASGYASLPPMNISDSPAAPIASDYPLYVITPDGLILAQASGGSNNLIGRSYTPPDISGADRAYKAAQAGDTGIGNLATAAPDGSTYLALPVFGEAQGEVLGILVLNVEPAPSMFSFIVSSVFPALLLGVCLTAVLLLVGVAPFGTLFGFIMARGLTRRLGSLTAAADAWSEGNFSVVPEDRARDEIGQLSMRLKRMSEQVQSLIQTRQALAALEERNRLARELHDAVKQQVFATQMQLRAARNLLPDDPQAAGERLEEAEQLVKASQQELGLIIAELRPAALEGQGLAEALRSYIDTWSQHAGIQADLSVQGERQLPLVLEQSLYRIAQEALANVARHSGASRVRIGLAYASTEISLQVSDDGTGFDPAEADQRGFGLDSMRQRAAELGGSLSVESHKGQGSTIRVVIPLKSTGDSK